MPGKPWSPEEERILVEHKNAGYSFAEIEKLGVLPLRNVNTMVTKWDTKFNPSFNNGAWEVHDLEHCMRKQRDSDNSNEWAKMSKDIKRRPQKVANMWKVVLREAKKLGYLDDEEQFGIEPDGDDFEAQVKAIWPAVKKIDEHIKNKGKEKAPEANIAAALSSETVRKNQAKFEKGQKRRKTTKANKAKKADMEEELQKIRITSEEKRELADPNCEKEWVKRHRAREKMLIESGLVTQEKLDSMSVYYESKIVKRNMVAHTVDNKLWQPPKRDNRKRKASAKKK